VQQFRELMLQCGADPASSSSRFVLDDESVDQFGGGTPPSQEGLEESELSLEEGSSLLTEAQVRAFLQSQFGSEGEGSSPASSTQASGPKENGAPAPWVPAAVPLMNGARQLPEAYRERLVEHEGGVVVSDTQGPNALVLLSHVPDQPLLLPMVSETFRLQKVKIVRGWLETTDSGAVMDAFEVCDSSTGQPLSSDRATQLEQALMQAIQAPAARQVMVEIDGQVPQLDCFFGLPAGGSLPVSLAAARGALVDGPFKVSEAREVGRSLVFRGELMEGVASKEALDECARRLRQAMVSEDAPPEVRSNAPHHRRLVDDWECLLVRGKTSPLLLWIPLEDLAKELDPSFDQRLFFLLTTLATVVCVQYAAPEPGLNPPIGALLLSIIGAAEISRRRTADRLGVRLGLPLLLPSPAMGTFGVAARAKSLVPDAAGLFDLGASALMTALLASFTLIGLGLFMPPDTSSCTWVDPSVFPYVLRQLLVAQYDARSAVCTEPPLGLDGRYVPTSPAIAAGLFGVLMVALNSLPIGQLDGASLLPAAPAGWLRETILPFAAYLLLGVTCFSADADSLFPLVIGFSIFTFGVRPQLSPEPVRRDNVSQPKDFSRRLTAAVLLVTAYLMLMPASWLQGSYEAVTALFQMHSLFG